jgi:hypothetical protein
MKIIYAAALAALMSAPAGAAVLSVTGSLATTDPTFSRPSFGAPPTSVASGNFYYDRYSFTVSTSGTYSGTLTSPGFDNVLGLYAGAFDPASPLANVLIYDDDSGPGVDAYFQYDLQAGQEYTALVTHYYPIGTSGRATTGAYTLVFDGVGSVQTGVPEPATWAMMLFGFGGLGYAMRRRSAPGMRVRFA